MSKVISFRLKDDQYDRLQRVSRRLGRTPSESAVLLLEEALRQRDFAFVEFRGSPVGRQAYLQGTRVAVWQVAWLAREYGGDVGRIAFHLDLPPIQITAALSYAAAYPAEIEAAIADNSVDATYLTRMIPELEVVSVDPATS